MHVETLLIRLTGAEAALVVNNNAAALLLVLSALAAGREVIVSRGQAVEIGGGFRIPDVLRQSGARLVDVGTTNRTRLADYADAITAATALLLRVHTSNFRVVGFTESVPLSALVRLGHERAVAVADDLGSGCLLDTARFGLGGELQEPRPQDSVAAGADVICFSGDKLLGGPQAGLIVGRREPLAALRRHPLVRALRPDKVTIAGLVATLQHYQRGEAERALPVWQMIGADQEDLSQRAQRWAAAIARQSRTLEVSVRPAESAIGGRLAAGRHVTDGRCRATAPATHCREHRSGPTASNAAHRRPHRAERALARSPHCPPGRRAGPPRRHHGAVALPAPHCRTAPWSTCTCLPSRARSDCCERRLSAILCGTYYSSTAGEAEHVVLLPGASSTCMMYSTPAYLIQVKRGIWYPPIAVSRSRA